MIIDSIFTGSEVTSVNPVPLYVDGERTEAQAKNASGVPLWWVEIAVKDGKFVLPLRVKVPAATPPATSGEVVRFEGVEATAWKRGEIAYLAESVCQVDDLEKLLGGSDV